MSSGNCNGGGSRRERHKEMSQQATPQINTVKQIPQSGKQTQRGHVRIPCHTQYCDRCGLKTTQERSVVTKTSNVLSVENEGI